MVTLEVTKKRSPKNSLPLGLLSGERGIRTPGGVTLNSFQDCRIRPLCHFSMGANIVFLLILIRINSSHNQ